MSGSVADLTDGVKACLRLYYQRFAAKEIARQLQISPATVHQRLTSARKILGVATSMEAARLLAEAENGTVYDRVLYDGIDVASRLKTPPKWTSRLPWPLPTRRRPLNDLSFTELLIVIVVLATLFMVATAIYLVAIRFAGEGLRSTIQV